MTKHRISVSIDEQNFFWIVVDKEKLIKNPTKEDRIETKLKYYNPTNICPRCRYENNITDKSILYPGNACHERYKETKEWICANHWRTDNQKYNINSQSNIIKSLRYRRTGNLDPNSEQAKGDKFQELNCIWRSKISTISVEDLNKKYDNYNTPIDHSRDSELGIIQTKGRLYDPIERMWNFTGLEREWGKKFDVIICYCASKDGKIIERIYIIPFKKEIKDKRKSMAIVKNPTNSVGNPIIPWYEKYRITDKETIKTVNAIWKEINQNNKSK